MYLQHIMVTSKLKNAGGENKEEFLCFNVIIDRNHGYFTNLQN